MILCFDDLQFKMKRLVTVLCSWDTSMLARKENKNLTLYKGLLIVGLQKQENTFQKPIVLRIDTENNEVSKLALNFSIN